jgi:hypothetical protein
MSLNHTFFFFGALWPASVVGWEVHFNLGVMNDDNLQIPQLETSHV